MVQTTDVEGTRLVTLNSDRDGLNNSHDDHEFLCSSSSFRNRTRTYTRWSPVEEGVTLAWNDLTIYAKTKKNGNIVYKRIINGVSGAVKAGSLVALMGASGAGKSTLMSALAYRTSAGMIVEGDILINGRPVGNYMKFLSGYMHQEDIFVPSLTVLEHMNIMANLKLDRRLTSNEKRRKILEILKQLGLIKCINSRIGSTGQNKALSGGEKKRLSFATELLTDPPILFCDEPTTGLDSYSAQKLVMMMNTMVSSGNTIVCTIHQPSSDIFAMFSQLILLAEGRIAYMGVTANAIDFFEKLGYVCPSSYSPADIFIKLIVTTPKYGEDSKHAVKRICDQYSVSDYAKEVDVVVQYEFHMGRAVLQRDHELRRNFKEPFWWSKLYWLTYRWILELWRNSSLQTLRLIQRMFIALIIGLCYLGTNPYTQNGIQSVQGAIFLFVTENTFTPMYALLAEFPENTPMFLREYRSGLYHPSTYYLSRIIALLPGFILEPFLFTIISYWLSGLQATAQAFFTSVLLITLTMNIASACGIMFSNAFESVPTAMAYLVPFDYILMITSGLFIRLSSLPNLIYWTKYLSWLMYATESLSIVQWTGISNIRQLMKLDDSIFNITVFREVPCFNTILKNLDISLIITTIGHATCDNQQAGLPCITEGSAVLEKYSFSEENFNRDVWCMVTLLIVFYVIGYMCLWLKTKNK